MGNVGGLDGIEGGIVGATGAGSGGAVFETAESLSEDPPKGFQTMVGDGCGCSGRKDLER